LQTACGGDRQLISEVKQLLADHETAQEHGFVRTEVISDEAPLFETHADDPYIGWSSVPMS
jgi:hypothetical protein